MGRGSRALLVAALCGGCIESFTLRDAGARRCTNDHGGCPRDERCVDDDAGARCECAAGRTRAGGACWAPPRPLWPMSTATVTSHRPTLRWTLPDGGEVRVSLCRDRAMTLGCTSFDAAAARGVPPRDLAPGAWFWRVQRRVGGELVDGPSVVWQLHVGARSAPTDLAWGTTLDVNGDGFADVAVGTQHTGAAYVYLGGPDATTLGDDPLVLTVPAGQSHAVASAGDVNGDGVGDFVVGAPNSGAVYLYLGHSDAPALRGPPYAVVSPAGSASFGSSVAGVGDIDGDGFGDVLVGAVRSNTAYLYFGDAGATPLRATPVTLTGPPESAAFGNVVAGIGDVNGDGHLDLGVGAFESDRAYVYLGVAEAPGVQTTPITLEGEPGSRFGGRVSRAGDVNGDGFADVVVGAHALNRAFVFAGAAGDAALRGAPTVLQGPSGSSSFGNCDGAGDLNGDGFADVVVGGPGLNLAQVYLGGDGALALRGRPTVLRGPAGSMYFGTHVSGVGDVNGDGRADLAVSAFLSATAYVYLGATGAAGVSTEALSLSGPTGSRFGFWIASAARAPRVERAWQTRGVSRGLAQNSARRIISATASGAPGS